MQCRQSTTGRSTTLVIRLAAAGPQDEWPRIQGEQPAVITHTIHPALAVWQHGQYQAKPVRETNDSLKRGGPPPDESASQQPTKLSRKRTLPSRPTQSQRAGSRNLHACRLMNCSPRWPGASRVPALKGSPRAQARGTDCGDHDRTFSSSVVCTKDTTFFQFDRTAGRTFVTWTSSRRQAHCA